MEQERVSEEAAQGTNGATVNSRDHDVGMRKGWGRELTKIVVKESSCGRPYSSLTEGEALAVKELNKVVC